MNNINLYPTIDQLDIKVEDILIEQRIIFEYSDFENRTRRSMNPINEGNTIILRDQQHRWSSETDNLFIRKKFKLKTSKLFGENGIAHMSSIIGIATIFTSNNSLQRGSKENTDFRIIDEDLEFYLEYEFDKNQLRGDFSLELILYLKEVTDEIDEKEIHLSNIQGSILGSLYKLNFKMSGDTSSFPTITSKKGKEALWKFHSGYSIFDSINDSILLEINEDHRDYSLFDYKNKETYNANFVKEVMISIIFQLIIKHREEFIDNNTIEFDEGTIGFLVSYYIDIYDLDLSNISNIFVQISKGIRK